MTAARRPLQTGRVNAASLTRVECADRFGFAVGEFEALDFGAG